MSLDRRRFLATAAAGGLAAIADPAFAASPLDNVLDRIADGYLQLYPNEATAYGFDKGPGAPLKARLNNRSRDTLRKDAAFCLANLKALAAIPDAGLSAQDRLDKATIAYAMELGRDAAAFDYGDNSMYSAMSESPTPYVVSQSTGDFASVAEFLDSEHQIATPADADAYLSRLHDMARNLDFERERIEADTARGVVAPQFILTNTIGQQEGMLGVPAGQAKLTQSLARRTKGFAGGEKYEAMAASIVQNEIYPALARQKDSLKAALASAGTDAGVWRLPDGEAYYHWCLRVGASTALSADEIHEMGQEQNRAIDAEMDAILRANGLTQGTVGERMAMLGRDPKYLFPDSDAGREQLLAYLNEIVAQVRPRLADAFHLKLKAPVTIKRVPADIQDGAGQGYMNFAAADGSRPAIYYINLKSMDNWPRFSLPDLTYHETIPGHAWQGAYLTESGKVRRARLLINGFNAYVEGYALYAEQLADEIGLYRNDWAARLGYLNGFKFRAVRLIVDTGIHAKRWSREQAVAFAMQATGRARDGITSEIDRYVSWPGQACGYKIGQTEIVRLRAKAKAALGSRFDLKAYNDLVVKTGAVPLTVLSGVVDDFIRQGGRSSL